MHRKLLPLIISSVCLTTSCFADTQVTPERPNILLILAEDMNSRIGAYGDPVAKTPNLDALAKESVIFTNVFTMAGVCAPSRAGLITGAYPQAIGLQHMRTATRPEGGYIGVPPAYIKGYPELLRRSGYFTYNDVKTDYQFTRGHADVGPFSLWSKHGDYSNMKDLSVPSAWRNYDLKGKPFFINLNPQITHESAIFTNETAPPGFNKMVELWDEIKSRYRYIPTDPDKIKMEPFYIDTPETRKELARHYDNIQIMDMQVGKVISDLKKDNLWENTIVIFSADNGDGIPRHKREGYDSGTHVPMIVHIPEKYRPAYWKAAGSKDERLVSFEDLAPTILGFAGVKTPDYMNGIDLSCSSPPNREFVYGSRGRMDNAPMRSLFVRDKRFQYVRNFDKTPAGVSIAFRDGLNIVKNLEQGRTSNSLTATQAEWFAERPSEELYDISNDPYQIDNLAKKAAYQGEIRRLREEMDRWRSQTNDMNLVPEDDMVKDLLDEKGNQHVTLPPVIAQDEINHRIYISNRTSDASIGYSYNNQDWDLYTKSVLPPQDKEIIYVKSVRYGWQESPVVSLPLR
ncbi:sulfatase family protein [Serratia entomophila]|uniref:sulfatase family protein n=1 Tax=Serratia entomophila TaxID=42906 RepID=UPI002176F197|nr:sulfatase [Serratia entomophila]CAI0780111.1 Arylsulfatase [Serratia entomophila]CAI1499719.1 Arylsulfatase [Serratia entomophila]CAI1507275.1 Arylsulfatase [Serratia entomophila]CAI1511123.1 Arylsulfatase [Serratia entomophila]CAI1606938.1 Arylsulfatase [Serratia entomophila]